MAEPANTDESRMSETDTVVAALLREHDQLTTWVGTLSDDDLREPSGAGDRNVAQVLGHLGSSTVINLGTLHGALGEVRRSRRKSVAGRLTAEE